ncbi:MAG: hypothetical protein HY761_10295 [Candidatus Omnitrophica bacterium]|nr:hypothetical protein [Candidatus Omnitrophota bacterium]
MKKRKVKTYLDTLMGDKRFRGRFAQEYEKLEALAAKENGKEKHVTKKSIDNLKNSLKTHDITYRELAKK